MQKNNVDFSFKDAELSAVGDCFDCGKTRVVWQMPWPNIRVRRTGMKSLPVGTECECEEYLSRYYTEEESK